MCPCCVSCTKKIEKELPGDELWQLCRTAFEQYKSEIINGEKTYSRYANDWFYYHLPVSGLNEADMKAHFMHVCELRELLEERRDLVDVFFSKDKFDEKDCQKMLNLFNSGNGIEPEADYLAHFTNEQIARITDFATASSLFRVEVTEEDIKNLFECKLKKPLQANNNRNIALFFGALREHGLLPFQWQMIMERNKLLSSSSNNEPLRASQLRCSLSQARNPKLGKKKRSNLKDDEVGFESTCRCFVIRLKESM